MLEQKTFQQLYKDRLKKLHSIEKAGVDPYPNPSKVVRSHKSAEVVKNFSKLKSKKVKLAGRLMAKRGHGAISFADLFDESGRIQLAFKKDDLGEENYSFLQSNIERGDFVQIEGKPFLTKAGEKTIEVFKWTLLSKTLYPLPEKWSGLKNQELLYRKRYLDLIMNSETRDKFRQRSLFIQSLREFLTKEGFFEVETPILQQLAGGAIAKPFKTHHNALGQDYYLRIAPELYLKRLIVGGYEKVFEFARNFRNEGISPQHNPDFTMLEFYWAYADYNDLMEFSEKMLGYVIPKVIGKLQIEYMGKKINFKPPYPRIEFSELIKKELKIDIDNIDRKKLLEFIKKNSLNLDLKPETLSDAKLIDEIYKKLVRPKLKGPLFLLNYPKSMIPLAKTLKRDPQKIASFQLLIDGWEIIKAYNELNDPIDQEKRFKEQSEARKKGDEEAHSMDHDYIEALNYGMPPTAGWGMGIDRFLVILLNQRNIRDVILFPLRRKKD